MLLQVIRLSATIIINDGKNSNLKGIHHLIEQHMHLYVLIIISLFLVVHWEVIFHSIFFIGG